MTGLALPIDASGGSPSFSGKQHRAAMAALSMWDGVPLAGRSGVRPMGGSAANIVTLSGSTITIGTHVGLISPGWSSLTGVYQVALTASETKTLTAQGAQPRKDIVCGQVYDDSESASGLRIYRAEYVAGTPSGSPVEPSVPTGAIKLATIDVPASGGGSPAVTNNYSWTSAAGGLLPVRSQAARDAISNPHDGQAVYRTDRDWVEIYDGTAWRVQGLALCSSGSDRDTAVTHPYAGQLAYISNVSAVHRYSGSAWVPERPAARMLRTTGGNVASGSMTVLALNTEDFDTHGGHDNVTNSSRYTVPIAGVYRVSGSVGWAAQTSGSPNLRQAELRKNGTTIPGSQGPAVSGATTSVCATNTVSVLCAAGDYIELAGLQSSGSTVGTSTTAAIYPVLCVEYIGYNA